MAASGCFPDVGGKWATLTAACAEDPAVVTPLATPSMVVEMYRADAVAIDPKTGRNTIAADVVRAMLDGALDALAPGGSPWRTLLPDWTPETRIGIKVNVLNSSCPTSPALAKALVDSLVENLGASRDRIIVWDRSLAELQYAHYPEASIDAQLMGTEKDFGESACGVVAGSVPRLSKILTDLTDLTINLPVLKTHGICGVTGALKNIYGVIDNPGDYHSNIETALPALYSLPLIRHRFRLHIIDALVAVTNGDTSSNPDAVPKRLLASTDPLAIDRRALALVDELRSGRGLKPLDQSRMGWMRNAHTAGLGSLDFDLRNG